MLIPLLSNFRYRFVGITKVLEGKFERSEAECMSAIICYYAHYLYILIMVLIKSDSDLSTFNIS